MNNERSELRWGVEQRLEFIEFRLFWEGHVNRSDLMDQFGVSVNQASTDLSRYIGFAPENIVYDKSARTYIRGTAFEPVFNKLDAGRYLAQIRAAADDILDHDDCWISGLPDYDAAPTPTRGVDPVTLRSVVGGIRRHEAIEVKYQSLSAPEPRWRWIAPHAIAFDGFRWHTRAFCLKDECFKDFLFSRMLEIRSSRESETSADDDCDWHSEVTLEVAPHPALSETQARVIALDYGMRDGKAKIKVRRALLDFALRRLGLAEAMRAELPAPPDVSALFDRLANLNSQRAARVENRQKQERDAERKRSDAERLRSEASLGEIDVAQGRVRVCSICRVPVDEVLAKGCGISLERCDVKAIKDAITEKRDTAAKLDNEAQTAALEAKRIAATIDQIDQEIRGIETRAKDADATVRAAQQAAATIQERVYKAKRVLDDDRALRESAAPAQPASSATDELEIVRTLLEQGRKRAQQAIQTLEERYRGIMSAWLPEGVDGAIKLDGRGVKVDAQFSGRGEVSTAALDSLKIVAFDLAALHLAVEEKADLPAFLIHDSPREADLDGTLYARLFELVQRWEDDAGLPCFQYTVTTTTAPPAELQNDQYVRLQMSSTPADERLFRMDL